MTRIVQCGWETGDVAQRGTQFLFSTASVSVVSATPTPPGQSTYCLKCGLSSSNNQVVIAAIYERLAANETDLYIGFSAYRSNSADTTATTGNYPAFVLLDSSGNINFLLTIDTDGMLKCWYQSTGGATFALASMTLIGTATFLMPLTVWIDLELHVIAATGSTGTVELRVGGVTVLSATSQRTCQTNAHFRNIQMGYRRITATAVATAFFAFDNYRINNTSGSVNNSWPGLETIRLLAPTSAGDSSTLTRGGTDSGANWSQVDERPPTGSTDYVYSAAAGDTDLYNTTTFTVNTVSCVNVIGQLFNGDGSGGTVALPTKTGAGQSDGSATAVTGVPMYTERLLETDPADSAAWSQTKIDALQVGIKVVS